MSARYIQWTRDGAQWHAYANGNTGRERIVTLEHIKRGTRRLVLLTRRNGSTEVCSTMTGAKAYANELARLWNYQPLNSVQQKES